MSHSPGKTSSTSGCDVASATIRLAAITASTPINQIQAVLGSVADLHLVGGTVRDALLGLPASDLDLATVLSAEQVTQQLAQNNIRVVETGVAHGTVMAVIDAQHIEITTFRSPSQRESSRFSKSVTEDLSGRDFTINAIAYSLNSGRLIDPFAGIQDLDANLLRAVGQAEERFIEDPLRILRMIRFGPAAKRRIDAATLEAGAKHAHRLAAVSVERLRTELVKILVSADPAEAFRVIARTPILSILLPEAVAAVGFPQNEFHLFDVFEHTLRVIEFAPNTPLLRLAALYHDLGKPGTLTVDEDGKRHFYKHEELSTELCRQSMHRLKFSHTETESALALVKHHMRPLECGPPGVRRLMRDLGPLFEEWISLKRADLYGCMLDFQKSDAAIARFLELVKSEQARLKELAGPGLAIGGNDLIALGLRPGKAIGQILAALEEMVIEEPALNTQETLLQKARELIAKLGPTK